MNKLKFYRIFSFKLPPYKYLQREKLTLQWRSMIEPLLGNHSEHH